MSILIGHASINEINKATGGQPGDQTKKEVCTRSYYLHHKGWYLLRPKSIEHANDIATAMLRACNNDNLGYSQSNRLGVIKHGTNSKVKTECDCSSLVRQCVIEGTGIDAGNFITSNEKDMLYATGLFEEPISVTKDTVVYNGDILVTKTKGHTVIVVSGNPRTVQSNNIVPTTSYLAKTTDNLNLRSSATSASITNIITVIPKDTYVYVVRPITGVWVQVNLVMNNKSYSGYVSKNYLSMINITNNEQRQVIVNGLNIRTGKGMLYSKLRVMHKDDKFTVITPGKWGLILYQDKLGYANISDTYSRAT